MVLIHPWNDIWLVSEFIQYFCYKFFAHTDKFSLWLALFLLVVVRTLTGHRSNCTSVDFHPFGEFFASGSLDTNLKIWDIRKKGCIHTYKGHTRGVNAIRFTPDGRWVVSGGEDNTVKVIIAFPFHDIIRVRFNN